MIIEISNERSTAFAIPQLEHRKNKNLCYTFYLKGKKKLNYMNIIYIVDKISCGMEENLDLYRTGELIRTHTNLFTLNIFY